MYICFSAWGALADVIVCNSAQIYRIEKKKKKRKEIKKGSDVYTP